MLSIKLPHLDGWNAAQTRLTRTRTPRAWRGTCTTPAAATDVEHIYHLYVIQTPERDALERRLEARQIQTGIHYPVPAHLQEACAALGYTAGDFPVTEAAAPRILSLPMFAELTAGADRLRLGCGARYGRLSSRRRRTTQNSPKPQSRMVAARSAGSRPSWSSLK